MTRPALQIFGTLTLPVAAILSLLPVLFKPLPGAAASGPGRIAVALGLNLRPALETENRPLRVVNSGDWFPVAASLGKWLSVRSGRVAGWIQDDLKRVRLEAGAETELGRAESTAADIRRRIAAGEKEIREFSLSEKQTVAALDGTALALDRARKRHRAIRAELDRLEERLVETQRSIQELSHRIQANRDHAARRLAALYKLDRIGRLNLLASAGTVQEMIRRQLLLARVLDRDLASLQDLAGDSLRLRKLLPELERRQAAKARLEADLAEEIHEMARQTARRQQVLAEIQSRKSLQMAALEALRESAEDLDRTIRRLGLEQVQTEPSLGLPDKPFSELKGLLKMPVKGKVILRFGARQNARLDVLNVSSGIDIQTERGEPVRCVGRGIVVFADWFKNFGNMIIIDHGKGFHTVYANVEELFKTVGEPVQAGDVIATVGESGPETGAKLHFEIRVDSKPVDPLQWTDGKS